KLPLLTLDDVRRAVTGTAAAFRCVTAYQPAGGAGDKVFPPTYEGGKYATEKRRVPGEAEPVDCVLLDSVQSQANRMEEALRDAWEAKEIPLPVIAVDFPFDPSGEKGLYKSLRVTSLDAPHRIADALLRDSCLDGVVFRESEIGRRLDHVDIRNATALFELCPTALVFGMWDSTGPRGGLGAKFARAIVSETVGLHAQQGVKTSSRIDPAQIMLSAGPLYKCNGGKGLTWTLNSSEAAKSKKEPAKLGKDGKPSEANHGNITPTITEGGVTISKAIQTTVISLPGLRRLRFPLDGTLKAEADNAARTVLAALGLLAATLVRERGCDLRSRCLLVPTERFVWELIDRPGEEPRTYELTAKQATDIYKATVAAAGEVKLPWRHEELKLEPSRELLALVKKSQELAANMVVDGTEGA
ncbi:MAG: type I-U CRISPR-associated RAMP protein Csb1/Cas7u, partial [Phycisphaerae bacterium]